MGVANVPSAAGGGIKSVQRGSAASSGDVTITAVDIAKSFVTVFGSASSGSVAATGAIGAVNGTSSSASGTLAVQRIFRMDSGPGGNAAATFANAPFNNISSNQVLGEVNATGLNTNASNVALNATNITGGTNNLVAAVVQGFLANSTTLTVSGACRFEVVEFA